MPSQAQKVKHTATELVYTSFFLGLVGSMLKVMQDAAIKIGIIRESVLIYYYVRD